MSSQEEEGLAALLAQAQTLADHHLSQAQEEGSSASSTTAPATATGLNDDDGSDFQYDPIESPKKKKKSSKDKKEKKSSKKDKKEKKSSNKDKKSRRRDSSGDESPHPVDEKVQKMVEAVENAKKVAIARSKPAPKSKKALLVIDDGSDQSDSHFTETNPTAKPKMGSTYVDMSAIRDRDSDCDDDDDDGPPDLSFLTSALNATPSKSPFRVASDDDDDDDDDDNMPSLTPKKVTRTPRKTKDVSNFLRDEEESSKLVELFTPVKSPKRVSKRVSINAKNAEKARQEEQEKLKKAALVKVQTSAAAFVVRNNSVMNDALFRDLDAALGNIKAPDRVKIEAERAAKAKEARDRKERGQMTSSGLVIDSSDSSSEDDLGFGTSSGIKGIGGIVGIKGVRSESSFGSSSSESSESDFELYSATSKSKGAAALDDLVFDEDENIIESSDGEISSAMDSDFDAEAASAAKAGDDDSETTDQETWEQDSMVFQKNRTSSSSGSKLSTLVPRVSPKCVPDVPDSAPSSVATVRNGAASRPELAGALAIAKRLAEQRQPKGAKANTTANSTTTIPSPLTASASASTIATSPTSTISTTAVTSTSKTIPPPTQGGDKASSAKKHSNPLFAEFDDDDADIAAATASKPNNIMKLIKRAEGTSNAGGNDGDQPRRTGFELDDDSSGDDDEMVSVFDVANSDSETEIAKQAKIAAKLDKVDRKIAKLEKKQATPQKPRKQATLKRKKPKKNKPEDSMSLLMGDTSTEYSTSSGSDGSGADVGDGSSHGDHSSASGAYSDETSSEDELDPNSEEAKKRLERRVAMLAALQAEEKRQIKARAQSRFLDGGEAGESDGEGGLKTKKPKDPKARRKLNLSDSGSEDLGLSGSDDDGESENDTLTKEELLAQAMFIADDDEAEREMRKMGSGYRDKGSIVDQEEEEFISDLKAQGREVMRQQLLQMEKERQRKKMMRHSMFDDEFFEEGIDSEDDVFDDELIQANTDLSKKDKKMLRLVQQQRGKRLTQNDIDILLGGNAEQRLRRAEQKRLQEEQLDQQYAASFLGSGASAAVAKSSGLALVETPTKPGKAGSFVAALNKTIKQHQRANGDVKGKGVKNDGAADGPQQQISALTLATTDPMTKSNSIGRSTSLDEPDCDSNDDNDDAQGQRRDGGDRDDGSSSDSSEEGRSEAEESDETDLEELDEADCPSKSSDPQGYRDFMAKIARRDELRERQQLLLFAQHNSQFMLKSPSGASGAGDGNKSPGLALRTMSSLVFSPNPSTNLSPAPSILSAGAAGAGASVGLHSNKAIVPGSSRISGLPSDEPRSACLSAQSTASTTSTMPVKGLRASFSCVVAQPPQPAGPNSAQTSRLLATKSLTRTSTVGSGGDIFGTRSPAAPAVLGRNPTLNTIIGNQLNAPLAGTGAPLTPHTDLPLAFGATTVTSLQPGSKTIKKQVVLSRDLVQVDRIQPLENNGGPGHSKSRLSEHNARPQGGGTGAADFSVIRGIQGEASSGLAPPQGPTKHNAAHLFEVEDDHFAGPTKKAKNRLSSTTSHNTNKTLLQSLKSFAPPKK